MSGHSKWHNIQKTKGAQDAKRAAAFTKIAKELIVAVKEGGGITDPANNSRLATVITKAKAANMPNDNIKRCLEKAAGGGGSDSYESITYEGYGPGGVAVIVEAMTDNRNRTAGSMRHHFDKFGGNFYLEASTLFRNTDGVDMPAEFIIPNCKIQSNFTFTMASSGDPSTFTFTMDAFPDYTRFDKTKKVLAAIQIVDVAGSSDLLRDRTGSKQHNKFD